MGRRLQLASHLSTEELEQRYKSSKSVIERSHYQLIWLLKCGKRTAEAAKVTGYSQAWVYELVQSYIDWDSIPFCVEFGSINGMGQLQRQSIAVMIWPKTAPSRESS